MILVMSERPTSDALRAFRNQLRYSQRELATLLGIDRGRYANWEYDKAEIPEDIVEKLRELGFGHGKPAAEGRKVSLAGTPLRSINVVGKVSAGPGETNVDVDENQIYVPERLARPGALGFVVDGDSMMPNLHPGDVAIFMPYDKPKQGHTFLVSKNDEYRVKSLFWVNNGWVMRSLNKSYSDEPLEGGQILGFLIAWYRVAGSRETMDSDPNGLRLGYDTW